jgi:glycosyltransferase involved in cell wall biosynthesis
LSATILQIIPELKTGGAEKSVVEMTEAVVRAGGRSLVVTEGGALCDDVIAKGGTIIKMPASTKNPLKMWLNGKAIAKLIRDENISLVHARSRAPAWSGYWAARAAKVPFVTTYHGAYNQKSSLKGFYNGVMAKGDWVIANSKFTANLILDRHAPDPDHLTVIYRGVDVDDIDPDAVSTEREQAMRSSWGVDGDEYKNKKIILHAARLTEWKGQRDVIEAAAQLKRKDDDRSVMILAGDAQGRIAYENDLKELIRKDGLEERVKLVGHVSDMAAAYKLADIVVVASREAEAFGRAAAEAQAMGCPVIATDIGAPPEFLNLGKGEAQAQDQATAWLVPVADGAAIATRILSILEFQPNELQLMAEISRRYIKENFTTLNMQNQTIQVYETLLGGPLATVRA